MIGAVFNGTAEHLTVHQCSTLTDDGGASNFALTNCLLVNVTNLGNATIITNCTPLITSDTVFQTVGAGAHYLATNSGNRDAGTTNINPALLADLRQRTTYPPIVLSNRVTVDTTLAPQAQRDINTPDLGYHYAPIDYAVNLFNVSNVVLTLTNGVVLAGFDDSALWVHDGATLLSEGTPTARNHLCHYTCVQELPSYWGSESSYHNFVSPWSYTHRPSGRFRFTDFDLLAGAGYLLYHAGNPWEWDVLAVRDCDFSAGIFQAMDGTNNTRLALTNNLFHRSWVYLWSDGVVSLFNNLFAKSTCDFINTGTNLALARDNAFDSCILSTIGVSNTHTAYINMTDRFDPTNSTDKVLASLAWQSGPLGRYYQPTNSTLINVGSRYATNANLYHYTTTTNQVKEGTTTVDIGYHYIAATNSAGVWLPIDSDGDGMPDYVEDADGDGFTDPVETDWQQYNSPNGLTGSPGLRVFTPLR